MVDLHSHVIDGIDDGARSEEMSINMMKVAEECGTTKLICTPHYFRGRFIKSISEVKLELKRIKNLAEENNISIDLYCGQEIYLTDYLLKDLQSKKIGTINDSKYMLIEVNMNEIPKNSLNIIYELRLKGIVPIIAHPERYVQFIERPELINDFIDEGCLFQLNAGSLVGDFGKNVRRIAHKFLDNDIYSFLGSDGHFDVRRSTDLSEAINEIRNFDPSLIKYFEENGEKVIFNDDIYFEGTKIIERKKGIWGFLKKNYT